MSNRMPTKFFFINVWPAVHCHRWLSVLAIFSALSRLISKIDLFESCLQAAVISYQTQRCFSWWLYTTWKRYRRLSSFHHLPSDPQGTLSLKKQPHRCSYSLDYERQSIHLDRTFCCFGANSTGSKILFKDFLNSLI